MEESVIELLGVLTDAYEKASMYEEAAISDMSPTLDCENGESMERHCE